MLVSYKNLAKLVDLHDIDANMLADRLTFSGIEVEEVKTLASGTNLVIGEIVKCEKHPDSDHLHVLDVNLGDKYGINQIVCGAPNARKGLKVIVARVGAILPKIEIKKGVIRGVESNGMCCSLLELGVDSKYLRQEQMDGIEELPSDAPVGEEDVLGYLDLDDSILNLKILANRPDLLSLLNIAREVGAIFNRKVNELEIKKLEDMKVETKVGSNTFRCSQFSAKEVKNVTIKESPKWMKDFLMSMGVRSINNIVDIGNYVMLMTGQPLHMYDADKLPKNELIARDDLDIDFVALDEKTYKIIPGDIVITSDGKAMCLGGVMGSLECAVDENSKNIVIEAASFDAASVRHTSNRLGLVSESSQRFVKGTNHFQADDVLEFTADLIKELCDGKKFSNIATYQSEEKKEQIINSSVTRINKRLGTTFTYEEISDALTRLRFEVKKGEGDTFTAKVPLFRLDVTCDADLSEEVIRLLGFEHVKSILPCLDTTVGALSDSQLKERRIKEYLLYNGLDECLTYSLVSEKEDNLFALVNEDESYKLINPLTDDHEYFRKNIAHSLLKVASYNVSRQNKDLALFEISNIVTKKKDEKHLAILLVGNDNTWGKMKSIPYDFYHMKGLLEGIFDLLGIEASRYRIDNLKSHTDELHPGRSADIYVQNVKVGSFGELHPNKYKDYDLGKTKAVLLEMRLNDLFDLKVSLIKTKGYSKFPVVVRDLALVVDKDVLAKDIVKTIKTSGKGLVREAEIFDVFEGEALGENKKSIAVSITYGSDDHTLSEKEVSDMEEKIKFELSKTYHAALRG
ncbi:MAG: phenylalanine--tRNA ligase subunit beta [Bacilli bacterium]|nr:phenylalanine--tRNA ligase subunit beta [Bacilli bacterium]